MDKRSTTTTTIQGASHAGTPALHAMAQQEPGELPVFIARQPIFDAKTAVFAYELLFRSSQANHYDGTDPRLASSQTMCRALHAVGLDAVVGGRKAFVNFTAELMVEGMYELLPPDRFVLELLETTVASPDLLAACRRAKSRGYHLALDDVTTATESRGLLELADFVKLDLQGIPPAERANVIARYRPLGCRIIAEKIETKEELTQASEQGCDYFQGFFFCRPELMSRREIGILESVHAEFARELARAQLDYAALEAVIKRDVSLTVNLLRYLSSAQAAGAAQVAAAPETIGQALASLGEATVRRWGALVTATTATRKQVSELLVTCLVRGRFCERVGVACGLAGHGEQLFLMGLLSLVDAVLGEPMRAVLAQTRVPETVRAVLLEDASAPAALVRVLRLARACERGDWGTVAASAAAMGLTQGELAMAYYDSMSWGDEVCRAAAAAAA